MEIVPTLVSTSKLKNYSIINPAGEDLGQVQTFMIDIAAGRIAFAVVSFGGTLGLTDKWFAVPWDAMQWSPQTKNFVLNVPREAIKKLPGLGKNWEEELNLSALIKVCDAFGCKPYWAAGAELEERGMPKVVGKDTILT